MKRGWLAVIALVVLMGTVAAENTLIGKVSDIPTETAKEMDDKFKLNTAERNMLITSGIGEGLLMAENEHIPIRIVASKKENALITTHPDELKEQEARA